MNERRIALMRILDARQKITASELAKRFGVSLRTIQRDLDYLQRAGFPLYTEVGPHGGYRVLPNRILPPLSLNETEAFGLFLMVQLLERIPDFPFSSIRSHLAEQYYAGLPADVRENIDRLKDHIAFPLSAPAAPSPFTSEILQAAIHKQQLVFEYDSPRGPAERQGFPLGIYFERGHWYMPAKSKDRVLLFRVDRMKALRKLGEEQTPESAPIPGHGATRAAQRKRTAAAEHIEQRKHTTAAKEHSEQHKHTAAAEHTEQHSNAALPTLAEWMRSADEREQIPVALQFTRFGGQLAGSDNLFAGISNDVWNGGAPREELPFLARRLLQFGPEVKVLEPEELRGLVSKLLEESLAQYRHKADESEDL